MSHPCDVCGTHVVEGASYCHACGTSTRCRHCGAEPLVGSQFCHLCGHTRLARDLTGRRRNVLGWLIIAAWAAFFFAWLLILADLQSYPISGPAVGALAILVLVLSLRWRHVWGAVFGAIHAGAAPLWLIFLLTSPSRYVAKDIMAFGGLFYLAMSAPLAAAAWFFRPPASISPWRCRKCGYLPYGLTEPRCPECGTPFDPSRQAAAPPPAELHITSPSPIVPSAGVPR